MTSYKRLPKEERENEIKSAAKRLFLSRGFAHTTMEDIVAQVSLSKGGVYRIFPSTKSILVALLNDGLMARNAFYLKRAREQQGQLSLDAIIRMVVDSLLLMPDIAQIYVELLIAKRRDPELEALYQGICRVATSETMGLIRSCDPGLATWMDEERLMEIAHLMDTAVLGLVVLDLREDLAKAAEGLTSMISLWVGQRWKKEKTNGPN